MYGYDLDYCPEWYKDAWENSKFSFDNILKIYS